MRAPRAPLSRLLSGGFAGGTSQLAPRDSSGRMRVSISIIDVRAPRWKSRAFPRTLPPPAALNTACVRPSSCKSFKSMTSPRLMTSDAGCDQSAACSHVRAATARSTDSPLLSQRYFEITRPVRVSCPSQKSVDGLWSHTRMLCDPGGAPVPISRRGATRRRSRASASAAVDLLHVGVREGCSVPPAGVSAGPAEREPSIE